MKKIITILILGLFLTGCSPQLSGDIEINTLTVEKDGIEKVLKDKTQKEKANLKSKELAKVKIGKFTKNGIEIEIIGDIEKIDGGIQLFAKAWAGQDIKVYKVTERVVPNGIVEKEEVFDRIMKKGEQFGFGKDGTVEIERFRFYNPPVLVDDENGDIIREWKEEDENTKEIITKQRKLKYDPTEAIKQDLTHTIGLVGKENTKIIKDKVGNTTSTFYSSSGNGLVSSVGSSNWSEAQTDTVGIGATYNSDGESQVSATELSAGGLYGITKGFFPFDTSALDGQDITSAVFSVDFKSKADDDNDEYAYITVLKASQASASSLVKADIDNMGDTEGIDSDDRADITDISISFVVFTDFPLNETGIGFIVKDGYTKLGLREGHDLQNVAISGGNGSVNRVGNFFSGYTGTTRDPKLVVEHAEEVSRRIINIE